METLTYDAISIGYEGIIDDKSFTIEIMVHVKHHHDIVRWPNT